ncbi:Uncharacterised protein [Burkholderia mallei]|nr:hypothetical protein DM51_4839 [Burkholderia mallei]KGR92535.1 hypothetical protein X948_5912 [Burkholderia pseudomallei MSHR5608]AJX67272.1 hypothetical protein BM94_4688 [Burkholderia mallei]AJY37756.1 hypothetical protein BO07_4112 [Burkholderia mallei]KIY09116.1 hypothetical protein DM79_A1748 [Burkholderia mallei]
MPSNPPVSANSTLSASVAAIVSNTPAPRNCVRIVGRKNAIAVYSNGMHRFIALATSVRGRYGCLNSTRKLTGGCDGAARGVSSAACARIPYDSRRMRAASRSLP